MKTTAVRLYGEKNLKLESFELPEIKEDEILARNVSDSICMSSYKASVQGSRHKRVPDDVDKNPIILGHEFCGEIIQVGSKWQSEWKPGDKFTIQPAINYMGKLDAPGYSFKYIGGAATHIVIPSMFMEEKCLLHYDNEAFFYGSLSEPMSCVVGGFHANYHTTAGSYVHEMGIKDGGKSIILAGAGPMGLGAIDYAIHCDRKPSLLVVTDIDEARLERASQILTVEEAEKNGVKLVYVNTSDKDAEQKLMNLSGGTGYDDVFVYAPVKQVVEQGDRLLGNDGCLNFFAGPENSEFRAEFNFYNVHYASTHVVGTSGGNTSDMIESLDMMSKGKLNPASMITHVGGLNSVIDTTLNLPNIPGGKKLVYTHINMPMTALSDFEELGKTDKFYSDLAKIIEKSNGLWSLEAEKYVLANADKI